MSVPAEPSVPAGVRRERMLTLIRQSDFVRVGDLGGTLRPLQHSLVDPLATLVLDQIAVDTVFLGCNGVDAEAGVTNVNLPEAEMKKAMLRVGKRTVVLADSSKLGRVELAQL